MMRQAAAVTSPDKKYLWHPSGMRGSGTGTGGLRGAPTSGYELSSRRDEGRMHSLSTPRAARWRAAEAAPARGVTVGCRHLHAALPPVAGVQGPLPHHEAPRRQASAEALWKTPRPELPDRARPHRPVLSNPSSRLTSPPMDNGYGKATNSPCFPYTYSLLF